MVPGGFLRASGLYNIEKPGKHTHAHTHTHTHTHTHQKLYCLFIRCCSEVSALGVSSEFDEFGFVKVHLLYVHRRFVRIRTSSVNPLIRSRHRRRLRSPAHRCPPRRSHLPSRRRRCFLLNYRHRCRPDPAREELNCSKIPHLAGKAQDVG